MTRRQALARCTVHDAKPHSDGPQNNRAQQHDTELATQDEMAGFYAHLEQVLVQISYLDPASPKRLMRRLRRIFNRVRPDRAEMNILRGILSAMQHKLSRNQNVEG